MSESWRGVSTQLFYLLLSGIKHQVSVIDMHEQLHMCELTQYMGGRFLIHTTIMLALPVYRGRTEEANRETSQLSTVAELLVHNNQRSIPEFQFISCDRP